MSFVSRIKPLFDRVLVERIAAKTQSAGGILLPQSSIPKMDRAIVVAVGQGARNNKTGEFTAPPVKVGDTVVLPEFGGNKMEMDGKEYFLFRTDNLLGVFKE